MAQKITKISATVVASIDEVRRIYSKKQLEDEKAEHQKNISNIDEMLAVLNA